MNTLLIAGWLNGWEWVILVVLGLLLFGKRLPGIARSLGQSVVEFKKGIKGIKDDIDTEASKKIESDNEKRETIDVSAKTSSTSSGDSEEKAASNAGGSSAS